MKDMVAHEPLEVSHVNGSPTLGVIQVDHGDGMVTVLWADGRLTVGPKSSLILRRNGYSVGVR